MKKVKRVNISVYEDEWDELPKYIDVNRSEWVRQQVRKQISVNDDLKKIEMQLDAIEYQQKNLEIDKEFLINEKKAIIKTMPGALPAHGLCVIKPFQHRALHSRR